jgi:3-phosphoshikimate 1-carboxyvinyltransferase
LKGGEIDSFGDHRVAMSFAIASCLAAGAMHIQNTDCIATSYPEFTSHFKLLTAV